MLHDIDREVPLNVVSSHSDLGTLLPTSLATGTWNPSSSNHLPNDQVAPPDYPVRGREVSVTFHKSGASTRSVMRGGILPVRVSSESSCLRLSERDPCRHGTL